MAWLLKPEVAQAMRAVRQLGYQPTQEERDRFAEQMRESHAPRSAEKPRNLTIAGDTAEIAVDGVLTEKPDCFALCFGGGNTTYAMIRQALAAADADPNVKRAVLNVSSPGGHLTGLFETFAALKAFSKPIRVRTSLAASAAYGLAAVAGPIEAVTPAVEIGSIGVAVSIFLDDEVLDIASTEAPKKRPDLSTPEGQAMVREELDALHELFVEAIAEGRSASTGREITIEQVNAEFGRGGMFVAGAAKKRGMIDRVIALPSRRPSDGRRADIEQEQVPEAPPKEASAGDGGAQQERPTIMNLETLKKDHPELYSQIVDAGVKQERSRVMAHIKLGKRSGATDVAFKAIEEGKSVQDDEVFADYQAAAMNRQDQGKRQEDSNKAGEATAGAKGTEAAKDIGDRMADAMGLPPDPGTDDKKKS